MRYLSVCSGIEAATAAWHPLGWKPVAFAEIEDFPSAVLAHHYPSVPNLGDMTKIPRQVLSGEVDAPDVLVGGTPCFTAGHLVLTERGYRPIEQIQPGERVITHKGRLRRVVRTGAKEASVGVLSGVGIPRRIVTTPDHPFRSVAYEVEHRTYRGGQGRFERVGVPEWTPADMMPGRQWCALTHYAPRDDAPKLPTRIFTQRQALYVIGMYLGEGRIQHWPQSGEQALVLTLNVAKYDRLLDTVSNVAHTVRRRGSVVDATFFDDAFVSFIEREFGVENETRIPAWVYAHEGRDELLRGYKDTVINKKPRHGFSTTCTSIALAYGLADLFNSLGWAGSVSDHIGENTEPCYSIQASPVTHAPRVRSRVRHGLLLRVATGYEPTGEAIVYNLEVEEDHSFILNGAIVHNCQAFSVAGLREGLKDERGQLTLSFVELANAIDHVRSLRGEHASVIVWENVPGVLSSRDNAFGCFIGALAGEDRALEPPGKKWTDAGCVYGPQRAVAWRILDAQYFGLAQRRKRVFVVASARDDFDPAAVLFESEGVRRDTPPRREAGPSASAELAPSLTASGRGVERIGETRGQDPVIAMCLTAKGGSGRMDADTETLIAHTLRADGFDASEDGSGRGTPLVPVAFNWQGGGDQTALGFDPDSGITGSLHAGQTPAIAFAENSRGEVRLEGGDGSRTGALSSGGGKPGQGVPMVTTLAIRGRGDSQSLETRSDGTANALLTPNGGRAGIGVGAVHYNMAVRRLTPRECERLQGFADDYTLIPTERARKIERDFLEYLREHHPELTESEARRLAADGPRYRALGNSMAVPVMRWLGTRIDQRISARAA